MIGNCAAEGSHNFSESIRECGCFVEQCFAHRSEAFDECRAALEVLTAGLVFERQCNVCSHCREYANRSRKGVRRLAQIHETTGVERRANPSQVIRQLCRNTTMILASSAA